MGARPDLVDLFKAVIQDNTLKAREDLVSLMIRVVDQETGVLRVTISPDSEIMTRLGALEGKYARAEWFATIDASNSSGSIGAASSLVGQTGAFVLDQWPDEVDVVPCELGTDNRPNFAPAYDGSGNQILASDFSIEDGSYTLSHTKSGNIALLFMYDIQLQYLDRTKVLFDVDIDLGYLDVTDILGTSNQITVTNNGDGTLTLSTPQNIDTAADVTFASLLLSGLTAGQVVRGGDDKTLTSLKFDAHISGLELRVKDVDEFYLDPGLIDLAGTLYSVGSTLTKATSSLSASTIYYCYLKPPSSGYSLSATEIEYSTTAPAWSSTYGAYYHSSESTWRWIGTMSTNSSAEVASVSRIGGYRFRTMELVTSTQTWYTPAWFRGGWVIEWGGGGGSGGIQSSGTYGVSGAGGGGGMTIRWVTREMVGSSVEITIGAGGAAGAAGDNPGSQGETTSFGSICSATGGYGGESINATGAGDTAPGGKGGSGVSGDINLTGGAGDYGRLVSSSSTMYGKGGAPQFGAQAAANDAGIEPGGGGGGRIANSNTAGLAGAKGWVLLLEYE